MGVENFMKSMYLREYRDQWYLLMYTSGMVDGPGMLADWVVGWLEKRATKSNQKTAAGGGW